MYRNEFCKFIIMKKYWTFKNIRFYRQKVSRSVVFYRQSRWSVTESVSQSEIFVESRRSVTESVWNQKVGRNWPSHFSESESRSDRLYHLLVWIYFYAEKFQSNNFSKNQLTALKYIYLSANHMCSYETSNDESDMFRDYRGCVKYKTK